jgi:hypothetical protein
MPSNLKFYNQRAGCRVHPQIPKNLEFFILHIKKIHPMPPVVVATPVEVCLAAVHHG